MDLSVVITHYNQPGELERCLASIDHLPDGVDICVIDDWSSNINFDAMRHVVVAFRDRMNVLNSRVFYARPPAWSACGGARNYGAALTEGKWLWFVDGDDVILKDGLDALIASVRSVADRNVFAVTIPYEVDCDGRREIVRHGDSVEPWQSCICCWAKSVRRSAFVPFRSGVMMEDTDWWLKTCARAYGQLIFHSPGAPVYRYHRLAPGSETSRVDQLFKNASGEKSSILRFVRSSDPKMVRTTADQVALVSELIRLRPSVVALKDESFLADLDFKLKYNLETIIA